MSRPSGWRRDGPPRLVVRRCQEKDPGSPRIIISVGPRASHVYRERTPPKFTENFWGAIARDGVSFLLTSCPVLTRAYKFRVTLWSREHRSSVTLARRRSAIARSCFSIFKVNKGPSIHCQSLNTKGTNDPIAINLLQRVRGWVGLFLSARHSFEWPVAGHVASVQWRALSTLPVSAKFIFRKSISVRRVLAR
jgi:hypothetical protein